MTGLWRHRAAGEVEWILWENREPEVYTGPRESPYLSTGQNDARIFFGSEKMYELRGDWMVGS
jgi:hypothetical protein